MAAGYGPTPVTMLEFEDAFRCQNSKARDTPVSKRKAARHSSARAAILAWRRLPSVWVGTLQTVNYVAWGWGT